MSFACPHFDLNREWCLRLNAECVPGRPGCVLVGSTFAVPVEQRLRERAEENRKRALAAATAPDSARERK
ncbi:MAG TPA: hypothetical protein VG710_05510 [Opitutus sp.]|nr:hypothetical protein [Opitutus sp.]